MAEEEGNVQKFILPTWRRNRELRMIAPDDQGNLYVYFDGPLNDDFYNVLSEESNFSFDLLQDFDPWKETMLRWKFPSYTDYQKIDTYIKDYTCDQLNDA